MIEIVAGAVVQSVVGLALKCGLQKAVEAIEASGSVHHPLPRNGLVELTPSKDEGTAVDPPKNAPKPPPKPVFRQNIRRKIRVRPTNEQMEAIVKHIDNDPTSVVKRVKPVELTPDAEKYAHDHDVFKEIEQPAIKPTEMMPPFPVRSTDETQDTPYTPYHNSNVQFYSKCVDDSLLYSIIRKTINTTEYHYNKPL